ncbi:hypothetical protein [Streptomyces orinoci]|uniref:Uncharacterized protein n=1 Tax=Streptomyces orinoci TaxID=67339 RepID=A0ABV3K186_STRON|nr:hypothetical protein [Streptomyces orinoci]
MASSPLLSEKDAGAQSLAEAVRAGILAHRPGGAEPQPTPLSR